MLTNKHMQMFKEILPIDKQHLALLQDFLRIYFKAEWKRANGEIKDSKVQEYLDNNDAYKKILEIFNERLEEYEEGSQNYYILTKKYYESKKKQQIEIHLQHDETP